MEMERKTCLVEVSRCFAGERGCLFFVGGRLIDADFDDLSAREAALRILVWRDVYVRIGVNRDRSEVRIEVPLMELMMEAARLADEGEGNLSSLDVLDDSLSEAEVDESGGLGVAGSPAGMSSDSGDVPRIVLEGGAMRGLNELLDRFGELSGFEGVAVYSSNGELKGFFLPVPHVGRLSRGE